MKYRKLNKIEEKQDRDRRIREAFHGEGLYVFENNTKADLFLPKPLASGKKVVAPGEQFQGDSYYNSLIGRGLRLIRAVVEPVKEESTMSEEQKLILNQPDRITHQGQVEQVVKKPKKSKPLNEGNPHKEKPKDVLINEDPLSGVEIILE
jgi:hypothetical protein